VYRNTVQHQSLFDKIRIRIRPDPKSFGLKDPDPKLLISDPDPSLFHTKLYVLKMHQKVNKFIIISYTIPVLEKFKKLKISTPLDLVINQNCKLFSLSLVHRRIRIQDPDLDPDPKFLIFNLRIRIRNY